MDEPRRKPRTPGVVDEQHDGASLAPDMQALIDAAVAKALAGKSAPQAPANLPDQDDIDPLEITGMTLSRQGWVVPTHYGEPIKPRVQ
jgi:hypothetical protein